jgi:hypothetical protein
MRNAKRAARLAVTLALVACSVGAASSSALASVSIEPLSTKFTGTSVKGTTPHWSLGGAEGTCTKAGLSGTSNSTKTNFVNATPTFTECSYEQLGVKRTVTFSSSCSKEGTVPWTETLNEGGTFQTKLNCALVFKVSSCTVTLPEQTGTGGELLWKNVESVKLELGSNGVKFGSAKESGKGCFQLLTGTPEVLTLKDAILIEGIHA